MKLVWQFTEGRLLLLQIATMLGFAALGIWLWYRTIYLYVPAAGETARCITGIGAGFIMILLAEIYSFLFALWHLVLLRRRWEGIAGWYSTTWLVCFIGLVPVYLFIEIFNGLS